jgi:hypothetical protein
MKTSTSYAQEAGIAIGSMFFISGMSLWAALSQENSGDLPGWFLWSMAVVTTGVGVTLIPAAMKQWRWHKRMEKLDLEHREME